MTASRNPRSRRRLLGLSVVQILVLFAVLAAGSAGGYLAYNRFLVPETATAARVQTQLVRRGNLVATVSSTGTVTAVNVARLTIRGGGYLSEVNVKVGDVVKAGQPLARLDTKDLEIALRQQRANLTSAQARLAQTLAGATDADIQAAVSGVTSAQSQLARAQSDLTKLTTPVSGDDLSQAATLLEKARVALQAAQTDYDRVAWRGDAGATSQATALQNATLDYNAALANYNLKIAPPKDSDVEATKKALESAKQAVESANAKLQQLKAGPLPQDVAVARASVETAVAQVTNAELGLERATLFAPFDSVVQSVTAAPGEVVSAAFITIVDPENLRLDVNVDENDVARIELGQNATITLDALSGRSYVGRVIAIAPTATVAQGVATYIVAIQIQQPRSIKPGMTANVQIAVESRNNVLLVPARAVRTQGRERVVDVLEPDGKVTTKVVRTGLSNDQSTEVLSGLTDGDQVVISATGTRPGGAPAVPGIPVRR